MHNFFVLSVTGGYVGEGRGTGKGHEGIFWVMGIWVVVIQANTTVKLTTLNSEDLCILLHGNYTSIFLKLKKY